MFKCESITFSSIFCFSRVSKTAVFGLIDAKCNGVTLKSETAFFVIDCVAYFAVSLSNYKTSKWS